MNSRKLIEASTAGVIGPKLMEHLLETLAQSLLLYDDGLSIQAEDFLSRVEMKLTGPQHEAAASLYELGTALCRRFSREADYETLQDCLSLQLDLWRTGTLKLNDWMAWLEQLNRGECSLPDYDFPRLMPHTRLPEGFMIQDFHDLLLSLLESRPDLAWAHNEKEKLYALLGVETAGRSVGGAI